MKENIVLKLNNKKIDFRFGLHFLGEILDVLDTDWDGMMVKISTNQFKTVPLMMYQSAKTGFLLKGEEIDFTIMDLIGWLNKHGVGGNNKITESYLVAFYDSLKSGLPEEEGEGEKKN